MVSIPSKSVARLLPYAEHDQHASAQDDGSVDNLCAMMSDANAGTDAGWTVLTPNAFSDRAFLARVKQHYPKNTFRRAEVVDVGGGLEGFLHDLGVGLRFLTVLGASVAAPATGTAAALVFAVEAASIAAVVLSGFSFLLATLPVVEGGRILARIAVDAKNDAKAKDSLAKLEDTKLVQIKDPVALWAARDALLSLKKYPTFGSRCTIEAKATE